jgi:hypothetical protein
MTTEILDAVLMWGVVLLMTLAFILVIWPD